MHLECNLCNYLRLYCLISVLSPSLARSLPFPTRRTDYSAYSAESSRDTNGQTFHFSSHGVDAADDEILDDSEFELRSRASGAALSSLAPPPPVAGSERTEYVTHDVTGEDTLQTISLKYSVPVSTARRKGGGGGRGSRLLGVIIVVGLTSVMVRVVYFKGLSRL